MPRLVMPVAAALVLGFLVAMVVTGAQPVQRQLVRFEAKGVLRLEPEQVRQVTLSRDDRSVTLARRGAQDWRLQDGSAITPAAHTRLDTALKMIHRSGPVREIMPEELEGADTASFGLEKPAIVAAFAGEGAGQALTARFGGHNPEGYLQYMRLDGDPRLYLMSRFIAAELLAAFEAVTAP
jgi:hypothetical protein